MFRFILLSLAITYVNAGNLLSGGALGALGTGYATGLGTGYATVLGTGLGTGYATGLGTGYATGLGTGLGLSTGLGGVALGTGLGLSGGYGAALSGPVGPLPAAIQSRRTYEVRPVVLPQEPAVPQIIEVEPSEQPVQVVFRSVSSPVLVQQIHTPGAPGQVEATQSEDEPHRVVHEVLRPVIQEVREVIQPYRRVVQEVRPVVEEVHTVVAKGEPRLRTAVAPIAAKAAPIAYAQPVIESAPLLAKGYGGLGLGGYGKAAAKGPLLKLFLIISLAITYCNAGNLAGAGLLAAGPGLGLAGVGLGLDGGLGLAGGYGVGLAHGGIGLAHGGIGLAHGGIGLAGGLGLGYGAGIAAAPIGAVGLAGPVGPVPAAIQSRRTYEVRPVLLPQEPAVPQIIEVEPSEQPVQVVFRSISSPVLVQQVHTPGAPGQVEATHSEDEPHRVVHEVLRPVIQEVREVIQPFRRVTQEVRPVLEEVHTVVAKGEPRLRTAVAPVAAAPIIAEGAALGLADGKLGGLGLGLAGGYGKGAYSKAASKAA